MLLLRLAQALGAVVVVLLTEAALRLAEAADDDGLPDIVVLAAEAELHLREHADWGETWWVGATVKALRWIEAGVDGWHWVFRFPLGFVVWRRFGPNEVWLSSTT